MSSTNPWAERYCYFIIFLLLYLEWGYAPVAAQSISGTAKTALMILGVLPLCLFKSFRLCDSSFKLFYYLTLVVMIGAMRDVEIGNSILLYVPVFCAFILTCTYSAERVIKAYCNIVTFLAACSLIIYTLALTMPSVITTFPVLPNIHGMSVHNLGLGVIPIGKGIIRNPGITWEPGAFALLLCFAVFYQIVAYRSLSKIKIIINIIALITTFSTMGYAVLAIIVFVTRFRTTAAHDSKSSIVLLLLFAGACIYFLLYTSTEVFDIVFYKLSGFSLESQNVETTQARLDAIIYPGRAFLSSPVFGVGYDVFKNINETVCHNVATNTIVNWFAILGAAFGLPCTYFYFRAILKSTDYLSLNLPFKIALIAAFALLISTESLLRISLIYVIIFYGCSVKQLAKHA